MNLWSYKINYIPDTELARVLREIMKEGTITGNCGEEAEGYHHELSTNILKASAIISIGRVVQGNP